MKHDKQKQRCKNNRTPKLHRIHMKPKFKVWGASRVEALSTFCHRLCPDLVSHNTHTLCQPQTAVDFISHTLASQVRPLSAAHCVRTISSSSNTRNTLARAGLGPSPGWGPVRVGAHMGPCGPLCFLLKMLRFGFRRLRLTK